METESGLIAPFRKRTRRVPALVAAFFIATLPAVCSGCRAIWDSPGVKIELTDADLAEHPNYSGNIQLLVGATLTVVLFSNGTTGFTWTNPAELSDPTVLSQSSHKYEPPPSGDAGASGREIWTFKALRRGDCSIHLEYSQPWEGGTKGARTFLLAVRIS